MKTGLKIACVMIVLRHAGRFLLLKRKNPPHAGMVTPVGGKIDPFENPIDAAIRETREETGIVIAHPAFCGTLVETSPVTYNWISFLYLSDIPDLPPPACNEGELLWVDSRNLSTVPTPHTDHFIYHYILEDRPFAFNAEFDDAIRLLRMTDELRGETVYPPPQKAGRRP